MLSFRCSHNILTYLLGFPEIDMRGIVEVGGRRSLSHPSSKKKITIMIGEKGRRGENENHDMEDELLRTT